MMTKSIYRLNDLDLRLAEAGALLHDGDGLYFKRNKRSRRPGTGSCLLRFWLHGRERWAGLGRYPKVSLAAARKKAREYRTIISNGIDPIDERRIERVKKRREAKKNIVFKDCAEEYIAFRFSGDGYKDPEKAAARMRDALTRHVYPIIGPLPVRLIDADLVIEVLTPIWITNRVTADMVRAWIEDVLNYAKARGYRAGDNPAAFENLEPVMAKRSKKKVKHHASLHYDGIGEFSVQLGSKSWVSALALEFLILTAARPGEVAGARWTEFLEFEKTRIWFIPAHRMKGAEPHAVPLSERAIAILRKMRKFAEGEFVFPGRKAGKHLTTRALGNALRRMGQDFTPHGFRSTFRTWGTECTDHPQFILEICLAHSTGAAKLAGVDPELWKAYQRGKLLEKRRPIMEQWADFVVSSKFGSTELLPESPMQLVARDITPAPAVSLATNPIEPIDTEPDGDENTVNPQPPSQIAPMNAPSMGQMSGSASGQRPAALQLELSKDAPVQPPYLNDTDRAEIKPLKSSGDTDPNFSRTHRQVAVVLAQIDEDNYEVRRGGGVVGLVSFYNGETEWGWQFFPSQRGLHPSRKLHPNPESCLRGRFTIASVSTRNWLSA
jgi:integrase